jgi:hypothetical protein
LFLSLRFPHQNRVYTSPRHHTYYVPHPSHSRFYYSNDIWWLLIIKLISSFLHSPVTLSLLGPNILLSVLFSNTLSLRSSLSVSSQVSDPYKTTGRITVLYIIMFKFLDSKLEDERFCTKFCEAFSDFSLLLISSLIWF